MFAGIRLRLTLGKWSVVRPRVAWLALLVVGFLLGCAASEEGGNVQPQGTQLPPAHAETGFTRIVAGAGDSVGPIPGTVGALYAYRFRQVEPPSDRFYWQDRDLSFAFRPSPDALYLQVENRQDRPVWIEWDRCIYDDGRGRTGRLAHATTRWQDRYGSQPPTQIAGLQRYSDYVFPIDQLVDPAGDPRQLRRQMLSEDQTALQNIDRVFGVDLVFRVEDRMVTYPFRFKVVSVLPR
jgi:hypothetical protein